LGLYLLILFSVFLAADIYIGINARLAYEKAITDRLSSILGE
jgi:hypothetical protein